MPGPRKLAISAVIAAFAFAGSGIATYAALDKRVTIEVDGASREFRGVASTVGDVLDRSGVVLSHYDSVTPSADASVSDGQRIVVTYAKPATVTIIADGSTEMVSTYTQSISELLAARGITVGEADRVSHPGSTAITEGMQVAVQRVTTTTVTQDEPIAFPVNQTQDGNQVAGYSKVTTAGVAGAKTVTYSVVLVDGVEESRAVTGETVTLEPVAQVETVGTGANLNLAREAMWERVARCESTNRWNINTGNGYYGGLQFLTSTWLANGGGQFAPRADLATREQQITVANRLYARNGLGDWECKA